MKAGTTVTWINEDDIPHALASSTKAFKSKTLDTDDKFSFTFTTPGSYAYFCSLHPHRTASIVVEVAPWSFRVRSAPCRGEPRESRHGRFGRRHDEDERAQRFRDAALPHLDAVHSLAHYLLRNAADAEDATQECYLRALRHFDTFRGGAIKPWLFAILRDMSAGPNTGGGRCLRRGGRRGRDAAVARCGPGLAGGGRARSNGSTGRRCAGSSRRCRSSFARPSCCARSRTSLYREIADVVGAARSGP